MLFIEQCYHGFIIHESFTLHHIKGDDIRTSGKEEHNHALGPRGVFSKVNKLSCDVRSGVLTSSGLFIIGGRCRGLGDIDAWNLEYVDECGEAAHET